MTAALLATPVAGAKSEPTTAPPSALALAPSSREQPPSCGAAATAPGRKKTPRSTLPEWELVELAALVELHNQRIVESEASVLDDYWLLGRLLERVRGNFRRGAWLPWLDRRAIDHTRAKRARLLAQVFASAEELRGLTLHEALRIARQRKKEQAGGAQTDLARQFKSALKKLLDIAGELADSETAQQYSPLAGQVAVAAAALCRACRSPAHARHQLAALDHACATLQLPRNRTPSP